MSVVVVEAIKTAAGISRQSSKEAGKLSIELFSFDFANLAIKLLVWFMIAVVIDKIHFVITSAGVNVVSTIVNAFGYNLPTVDTEPDFFKKLFGEGYFGLKYWDFIKVGALILVLIEFTRWYETEKRLGGEPSAFTLGIFAMIMVLLSAFTIPQIITKLKMRMPAGGN